MWSWHRKICITSPVLLVYMKECCAESFQVTKKWSSLVPVIISFLLMTCVQLEWRSPYIAIKRYGNEHVFILM